MHTSRAANTRSGSQGAQRQDSRFRRSLGAKGALDTGVAEAPHRGIEVVSSGNAR